MVIKVLCNQKFVLKESLTNDFAKLLSFEQLASGICKPAYIPIAL